MPNPQNGHDEHITPAYPRHGEDGWDLVELDTDEKTGDQHLVYERRGELREMWRDEPHGVERAAYAARGEDRIARVRDGLFGHFANMM